MKLLNPKEKNKALASQRNEQAKEGLEISRLLKRGNKKLQEIEDQYDKRVDEINNDLLEFSKEVSDKKAILKAEIKELERNREQALKPITEENLLLDKKIEKFVEKERLIINQQRDLDKREAEVTVLEADNKQQQKELDTRENDLDIREDRLKVDQEKFHNDKKVFIGDKENWNKSRDEEQVEIDALKNEYELKLDALQKKEKRVEDLQEKLNIDKQHLHSQQQSLKAAFDEAKKKGIKYGVKK